MSRRAAFRPNICTTHRRLVRDILAQFARHFAGRYVWHPSVRRHIEADSALYNKIKEQRPS